MPQPWEKQYSEPDLWYARFTKYFLTQAPAGTSGRSLLRAYNDFRKANSPLREVPDRKRTPSSWDKACREWDWRARAAAWDKYIFEQWQNERVALIHKQAQDEIDVADKLMEKAQAMLKMPIVEKQFEDTETGAVTVIKPAGWTNDTLIRFIEAATRLKRDALEMGKPVTVDVNLPEAAVSGAEDEAGEGYADFHEQMIAMAGGAPEVLPSPSDEQERAVAPENKDGTSEPEQQPAPEKEQAAT